MDIIAVHDFIVFCKHEISYQHRYDFGPLRTDGRLKLRIEDKDY